MGIQESALRWTCGCPVNQGVAGTGESEGWVAKHGVPSALIYSTGSCIVHKIRKENNLNEHMFNQTSGNVTY